MKIRFCTHNKGSEPVYRRLKLEYPGMDIKRKDCLKKCRDCRDTLVALVGGVKVEAEKDDILYDRIVTEIGHLSPDGDKRDG